MGHWPAFFVQARSKLMSTLEHEQPGVADFTLARRALYAACEFRAAVEARSLATSLGPAATEKLHFVAIVYTAIGAEHLAHTLHAAANDLAVAATPQRWHDCLAALEERLLRSRDPLEQLIERFAEGLHDDSRPIPEFPLSTNYYAISD
jgi:hypothetical protein